MSINSNTEYQILISGTINGNGQSVDLTGPNQATKSLQLLGTWVGTLIIEASADGTNYSTIHSLRVSDAQFIDSVTVNGLYLIPSNSYNTIRITSTAWTSGTVNIEAYGSDASSIAFIHNPTQGINHDPIPTQSQLVGGTDGNNLIPLLVDAQGRLVTSAITGFGADFSFGDITTSSLTRVIVRRTAYTEQTSNAQRSIASSSANDSAAGTGARTVEITYLTSAGVGPLVETVTLNGTTYVDTVATDICFIEQVRVITAGSTLSNVGTLTIKAATAGGGATIGTILPTDNQTFWAHHYVPTGKICNITGISLGHNGTTVGSGALLTLNAYYFTVANSSEIQVSDFVRLYGQSSTFSRSYASPIKVTGPARILTYLTPETASTITYRAAFDYFEP